MKKFNVNEYNSWIISRSSPHNCLIIAKVEGFFDSTLFQEAVQFSANQQEMLRYSITSDVCYFVPISEKIPIKEIFTEGYWHVFAERELNKRFSDKENLMRITILRGKKDLYILICYHHIIADGASGTCFLLDIIQNYNQGKCKVIKLLNTSDNFIYLQPDVKKPDLIMPRTDIITKINSIIIEENIVKNLLLREKQFETTLNSYLSMQIVLSVFEIFKINKIQLHFPVNLRSDRSFNAANNLKFLTSWVNFSVEKFTNLDPNKLSNFIRNEIKNHLISNQHVKNLENLLHKINNRTNDNQYLNEFISKQSTVAISNTKNVKIEQRKNHKLKIVELYTTVNTQSYLGNPNSFMLQICMLNNCKICITINYSFPLVERTKIEQFINSLNKKLQ